MFEFLSTWLDGVFGPLLNLPPFWAILILCFLISLLMTLIYKYTTNQNLMKDLKQELKDFQTQMKELREQPEKMMEVQKKAMETNMKYMMHSMRSTLFTFIPIILIFAWLNANLAFMPIMPGEDFTTTVVFEKGVTGEIEINVPNEIEVLSKEEVEIKDGTAKWLLRGEEGKYTIDYEFGNKVYSRDVIITEEQEYEPVVKTFNDGKIKQISMDNEKMKTLNLFGWKIGWLGTYIIFSIIFSMVLRKVFKVY